MNGSLTYWDIETHTCLLLIHQWAAASLLSPGCFHSGSRQKGCSACFHCDTQSTTIRLPIPTFTIKLCVQNKRHRTISVYVLHLDSPFTFNFLIVLASKCFMQFCNALILSCHYRFWTFILKEAYSGYLWQLQLISPTDLDLKSPNYELPEC